MPALRLALENMNIPSRYRHVERERTAGRGLAVGAVAGVEQQRKRRDLVADRAAGAAAGQRKHGTRWIHGWAGATLPLQPTMPYLDRPEPQPALRRSEAAFDFSKSLGTSISTSSVETVLPRSSRTITFSGSSVTCRDTTARISSR